MTPEKFDKIVATLNHAAITALPLTKTERELIGEATLLLLENRDEILDIEEARKRKVFRVADYQG